MQAARAFRQYIDRCDSTMFYDPFLAKGKVSFPSGPFYIETKIKIVLPDKIKSVVTYLVTGQAKQVSYYVNSGYSNGRVIMAVNGSPSFRKRGCP